MCCFLHNKKKEEEQEMGEREMRSRLLGYILSITVRY
jgi:heme/copper-type cytochrome/quinol oxidase subunit 4